MFWQQTTLPARNACRMSPDRMNAPLSAIRENWRCPDEAFMDQIVGSHRRRPVGWSSSGKMHGTDAGQRGRAANIRLAIQYQPVTSHRSPQGRVVRARGKDRRRYATCRIFQSAEREHCTNSWRQGQANACRGGRAFRGSRGHSGGERVRTPEKGGVQTEKGRVKGGSAPQGCKKTGMPPGIPVWFRSMCELQPSQL